MASSFLLLLLLLLQERRTVAEDTIRLRESRSERNIPPTSKEHFLPQAEGQWANEETLVRSYGELKTMFNNLKNRLDKKVDLLVNHKEHPRIYGTNNIAVDPVSFDLDNLESFNDISSSDTTTTINPTTSSTFFSTTPGPFVIGEDALGRKIIRFINHWEETLPTVSTNSTQFNTVSTTPSTTTQMTTISKTTPSTTTTMNRLQSNEETTTKSSFIFARQNPSGIPDFQRDLLVAGPAPPVPFFSLNTPATPDHVFIDENSNNDPLVMGPPPPPALPTTPKPPTSDDWTSTSFFSRTRPTEAPLVDRTFPSFIVEMPSDPSSENISGKSEEQIIFADKTTTPEPSTMATEEGVEAIWWTPKPSWNGMSSILSAPPPRPLPKPVEPPTLWRPRWRTTPHPSTLPPPLDEVPASVPISHYMPPSQPLQLLPEVEQKVRKVAEQSVVNELEMVASSLDMSDLVKELRGEQTLPIEMKLPEVEKVLEAKKKILHQLEVLRRLADRKNELQELIDRQKLFLRKARDNRLKVIAGITQLKPMINEEFTTTAEPQMTTIISATPEGARWSKKRGHSVVKKRRQRQKNVYRKFLSGSTRSHIVDDSVSSVGQLTEMLEREMRVARRRATSEELRKLCFEAACTFEKGDFCQYETSYDEVTRRRKNRITREVAPIYVIRSWSNWVGSFSNNSSRVDKASQFSSQNMRFAGVFLEPQQLASLSLSISYQSSFTIRFRGWEATPGLRLRVCCDDFCPFSTELGRTKRRWRTMTALCPADTRQLAFECENVGSRKGVCAIDDIYVLTDGCPVLFEP